MVVVVVLSLTEPSGLTVVDFSVVVSLTCAVADRSKAREKQLRVGINFMVVGGEVCNPAGQNGAVDLHDLILQKACQIAFRPDPTGIAGERGDLRVSNPCKMPPWSAGVMAFCRSLLRQGSRPRNAPFLPGVISALTGDAGRESLRRAVLVGPAYQGAGCNWHRLQVWLFSWGRGFSFFY